MASTPDSGVFKGATAIADGLSGAVPAPVAGENTAFLRGDGLWASPAGAGSVVGPANSVDQTIAIFSGTSGTVIADTGVTINIATNDMSGVNKLTAVSAKIGALSGIVHASGGDLSAGNVDLTSEVSGILPYVSGGTNANTALGAFNNLSPTTTKGDLVVNNGINNVRLAVGTDNYVLTADSAQSSGVKWASAPTPAGVLLAANNLSDVSNTTLALNNLGALSRIAGGTMAGNLILNADPTTALGAATKQYVDTIAAGLSPRTSVKAATTANLTATYNNGTAGVGATLTNSGAQAALTLDGVSLSVNDRVLVKDQLVQANNGIYTVTVVGDASTNWVLTRATDYDESVTGEITEGSYTIVTQGTVNATNLFIETGDGPFTVGTTPLIFSALTSAANITNGFGLNKVGNTLSVIAADFLQPSNNLSDVAVPATARTNLGLAIGSDVQAWSATLDTVTAGTYTGDASIATVGTITAGTWNGTAIDVQHGGTGAATLTNHGILIGQGTAAVTAVGPLTDGQLLIGSTGNNPVAGAITAGVGISITTGPGSLTISSTATGITWNDVTGTSATLAVNNGYFANNAALVTFTLPATATLGDTFKIQGKGTGLWTIAQNASQQIHMINASTTAGVGGSLSSSGQFDSITLVAFDNNNFHVDASQTSAFTIV